jgi:predicted PurR-regulated permease PerM
VFLLSIYWSSDQAQFERLWLSLLPAGRRIRARDTWRAIEAAIGGYLLSEFFQSILAALLIGGGLALLGVPYPLLAGVVAAIAWLIPLAGAVVITVLAFVLGYSVSLSIALVATGYAIIVLCFLEFVVEPRFYNRQRYSSLLVILMMWPMAGIFGLPGLIFAPTLAAAVQLFLRHFIQPYSSSGQRVQIAQLETRYDKLQHAFRTEQSYTPEIANILTRLSTLLKQTKTTIRKL